MRTPKLLGERICDLDLRLEGTFVGDCIREVREELARREIRFTPYFWVSDEWFTPDGYVAATAGILEPIYKAMVEDVLASRILHTDDTPVPVLDRSLDRTRTARLWVYVGDKEHPFTVFDYTTSRRRDGPVAFLEGYAGYLQADAYGGYDGIYAGGDVVEVACWAHARRKFFDAKNTDAARGHAALAWIARLYKIEHEAKGFSAEGRKALRQEKSRLLLASFYQIGGRPSVKPLPPAPRQPDLAGERQHRNH
jgi:hypothetical protein